LEIKNGKIEEVNNLGDGEIKTAERNELE